MKLYQLADVVSALKKECEQAKSQRQWATANGVAPAVVNRVLKGKQSPTKELLLTLGFKSENYFVKLK